MRRFFGMMVVLCLIAAALTMTGCSRPQASTPSFSSAVPSAVPAATPFQPYALVNQPPPKPKVATHRNAVLRLTHRDGQVYLADSAGHLYRCGRDRQGHVFPIYQDPATRVTYPLYYDRSRDRLYRLARNDNGHYYRGYVGDPDNRFYADDPDYERISPEYRDRPIVTDSYNRYNYNNYRGYPSYHGYQVSEGTYYPAPYSQPPAHHGSHANTDWLWAIPVIVGAYLLLNPHHHSSPPSPPQGTVIVQRHNPPNVTNRTRNITIIHTNNTVINHNSVVINRPVQGGHLFPRPVPVRPRAAAVLVPALIAAHHITRPLPRRHPRVVHHAPPTSPARPHAAALVTPALRPTRHTVRPTTSPVHVRPSVRHGVHPPTHRPRPAVAAVPQRPLQRKLVRHPRVSVAPHSAPAKPRFIARPHPAPQSGHRVTIRRKVTRSARPMVHQSRSGAPSHPTAVQPHRTNRVRPSPRPAPHPVNHPRTRPSPRPAHKPGAGPADKKK